MERWQSASAAARVAERCAVRRAQCRRGHDVLVSAADCACRENTVPVRWFVHLLKDGGQQHTTEYKALNPQELIPTLVHNGRPITQSLAIIEYLNDIVPEPPLLPADAMGRARVRSIAYAVACDIHPVNNLRVNQYLKSTFGADTDT